jgi:hypothetical protein
MTGNFWTEAVGRRIVVFDDQQIELGEGTLERRSQEGPLTAYECREHTILVKGAHWVSVDGRMIPIPSS